MARGKNRFTLATRLIIGAVIFIVVMFAVTNFADLTISDPFVDRNFGFQALDLTFNIFDDAPQFRVGGFASGTSTTTVCTSEGVCTNVVVGSGETTTGTTTGTTTTFLFSNYIKPSTEGGYPFTCKLKLNTLVKDKLGTKIIELNSANFQQVSPLLGFSVATTSLKVIGSFDTEPRLACDVIQSKDGTRLPYKVTTSNLQLIVASYNDKGVRFVTKSNVISLAVVTFDDQPTLNKYIGTERPIGQKITTTASEIENILGGTTSFDARVTFDVVGSVFIEVPYLTQQSGAPYKTRLDINSNLLTNSMNLKILKGTTQAPTDSGTPTILITEIRPQIRVTDGIGTELIQVFTKLNNWNQNEGTPTCEVRRSTGLSQLTGGTISLQGIVQTGTSVLRSSDGVNSNFECRLFIPATLDLGKYEVLVKTLATNRPQAVGTFTLAKDTTAPSGTDGTTTGDTRKCYDCQGTFLRSVSIDNACPYFKCPNGETIGGIGGAPVCTGGIPAVKTGEGTYTCQKDDGTDDGGISGFPKFVECPEGVQADVSRAEICTPPFLIFLFTGFNFVWVGLGIIVFIIIIAIIASALKGRGGGGGAFLQG